MADAPRYPVGRHHADRLTTPTGKPAALLTAEAFASGRVGDADIGITAEALRLQAAVARSVGRRRLAETFERGAELVTVPEEVLLATYELLRPGRAKERSDLERAAAELRTRFGAERIARLLDEAAEVYERRGLFRRRF